MNKVAHSREDEIATVQSVQRIRMRRVRGQLNND